MAEVGQIYVSIHLDTTGLEQEFTKLQGTLNTVARNISKFVPTAVSEFEKAQQKLAQSTTSMSSNIVDVAKQAAQTVSTSGKDAERVSQAVQRGLRNLENRTAIFLASMEKYGLKVTEATRANYELGIKLRLLQRESAGTEMAMRALTRVVAVFGAGFAAGMLAIKKTTEYVAELRRGVAAFGVSAETLQLWQMQAQLAGANTNALQQAFEMFTKNLPTVVNNLRTSADAFKALNLNLNEFLRLSPEKAFNLVLDRLSQVEDVTLRSAIATTFFGNSWSQVIAILQGGNFGNIQLALERLGLIMSTDLLKGADATRIVFLMLQRQLLIFAANIARAAKPMLIALTSMFVTLNKILDPISKLLSRISPRVVSVFVSLASGAIATALAVRMVVCI